MEGKRLPAASPAARYDVGGISLHGRRADSHHARRADSTGAITDSVLVRTPAVSERIMPPTEPRPGRGQARSTQAEEANREVLTQLTTQLREKVPRVEHRRDG